MKQRIITAIILAIILVPIFIIGGVLIVILGILLSTIGSYEIVKMHVEKRNLSKKIGYIIPVFSLIISTLIGLRLLNVEIYIEDIVMTFIFISILLMIASIFNKEILMSDSIYFIFSIIYPGVLMMLLLNSRLIAPHNDYIGLSLLGYVVITTFATDIFAQLIGLKFGKKKLCPTISPKKSVEGSIGGTCVSTILGSIFLILMRYMVNFTIFSNKLIVDILIIIPMTFTLSIFAQFGDLIASRLKREYGIKDYGNIFPGHGGVMDRFDSLLLVGTVFYLILYFAGLR